MTGVGWRRRTGPTRRLVSLLLAASLLLPTTVSGQTDGPAAPQVRPGDGPPIRGVALVAPRGPASPDAVSDVADLGATWVAVVPYAFLRPETGELRFDYDRQFRGERSEGVREQVALARESGLKVLLKPHVWTRGLWIGDYLPEGRAAWRRWEEGYRDYLLHMARLAAELDVEMLAVGTELERVVQRRPGWMRELISDVREIYGGELTYAANWDGYREVEFWDALDYVGVDAYFPLSPEPVPEVEALRREWREPLAELEAFSMRRGRPILITEYGWRSVEGAAGSHWELPAEGDVEPGPRGLEAQARAYEAFFRSAWGEPWLAGAFLWKWFVEEPSARGARRREVGYTPQGKPAADVIRRWYGGPRPSSRPGGSGAGRPPAGV